MNIWPVHDAKARFSEFLDACLAEGPLAEWNRLQSIAKPSLKELLLSDAARTDLLVPPRGSARRRQINAFDQSLG